MINLWIQLKSGEKITGKVFTHIDLVIEYAESHNLDIDTVCDNVIAKG